VGHPPVELRRRKTPAVPDAQDIDTLFMVIYFIEDVVKVRFVPVDDFADGLVFASRFSHAWRIAEQLDGVFQTGEPAGCSGGFFDMNFNVDIVEFAEDALGQINVIGHASS